MPTPILSPRGAAGYSGAGGVAAPIITDLRDLTDHPSKFRFSAVPQLGSIKLGKPYSGQKSYPRARRTATMILICVCLPIVGGRNGTTRPRRAAKVRYWHLADVQTIASPGLIPGEKRTCLISVWMSAYDPSGPWSWGSFTYVVAAPMQRAPRLTCRRHAPGSHRRRQGCAP